MSLKSEEYAFTVKVRGRSFDVYHTKVKGKSASLGFCVVEHTVQIAILCAGYVTETEAVTMIEDGWET